MYRINELLGVCWCCVGAHSPCVFHFKPWQADWANSCFSAKPCPLTYTVAHIYLVAATVKPLCVFCLFVCLFFSFLAAEQLLWSSLDSAAEGIKSTSTVAESVLLIHFSQWDLFYPVWRLKPVTFKFKKMILHLPPLSATPQRQYKSKMFTFIVI